MTSSSGRGGNRYAKLDESVERDNDEIILDQEHQNEIISKETNEDLEALEGTLGTIQELGKTINAAVVKSNLEIDGLDEDIASTQGRMAHAIRRVNKLLDTTSERNSWIIVGVLVVILILVIAAVIFT